MMMTMCLIFARAVARSLDTGTLGLLGTVGLKLLFCGGLFGCVLFDCDVADELACDWGVTNEQANNKGAIINNLNIVPFLAI